MSSQEYEMIKNKIYLSEWDDDGESDKSCKCSFFVLHSPPTNKHNNNIPVTLDYIVHQQTNIITIYQLL